jgi:hypothetical protein
VRYSGPKPHNARRSRRCSSTAGPTDTPHPTVIRRTDGRKAAGKCAAAFFCRACLNVTSFARLLLTHTLPSHSLTNQKGYEIADATLPDRR